MQWGLSWNRKTNWIFDNVYDIILQNVYTLKSEMILKDEQKPIEHKNWFRELKLKKWRG